MKTRRYKDRMLQNAYDTARREGPNHPRSTTSGFEAYNAGFNGRRCNQIKGSIAYVFYCAGADARADLEKAQRLTSA